MAGIRRLDRDTTLAATAVYCFIAPEGLKNLAQGFNPGKHPIKRFALKGQEMAWAKYPWNATERNWVFPLANNAYRHKVERWRAL